MPILVGASLMLSLAMGLRQSLGKYRPAIERIRALARLNLDMLAKDLDPLGLGKTADGFPLGFDTQA